MVDAGNPQLAAFLHAHGLRVTAQRRAVYAAFDNGRAGHLSAHEVLRRARKEGGFGQRDLVAGIPKRSRRPATAPEPPPGPSAAAVPSAAPDGSVRRLCSKVWQLALIAGVRFVEKQSA